GYQHGIEKHCYSKFKSLRSSFISLHPVPIVPPIPSNQSLAYPKNPSEYQFTITNLDLEALFFHFPVPSSSSVPLQDPDQRFYYSEVFTQEFSSHLTVPLEKINCLLMKHWQDHATSQAELGGVLHGFALVEGSIVGNSQMSIQEASEATSAAIKWTGQAVDGFYYAEFPNIIKHLLPFRHMKQAKFEMARDISDTKGLVLEDLERNEEYSNDLNWVTSQVIGSTGLTIVNTICKPASKEFLDCPTILLKS
ncbi:hypothetical protein O181_055446, partial [Austropuccinia psidii MF-1]|nr:hypothetical protein [Austropuccinia psidii MF-1]